MRHEPWRSEALFSVPSECDFLVNKETVLGA